MSRRTRLLLLRHGEVATPYQQVFGGRIDMDLSANGRDQARALAEHLRPTHLDAIYVSPMRRAQQTVAPLVELNGYKPATLPGLQEVDFGAWTGLSWAEVREKFGVSAFDWLTQLERGAIPAAEPIPKFRARVVKCVNEVIVAHSGHVAALICHGGVIRMALAHLLELPLPKMAGFDIDYASVSVVDHHPHKTEVQLLNFTPWRSLL